MLQPGLSAVVQELVRGVLDTSVPEGQLDMLFQRVKAVRRPLAAATMPVGRPMMVVRAPAARPALGGLGRPPAQLALPAPGAAQPELSEAAVEQRKEMLLRAVAERLLERNGEDALNSVTSDPTVVALRKGAVGNVAKLLRSFPQHFELTMAPNPVEGKNMIQMVRLVAPLPPGSGAVASMKRKREEMPEEDRREALVQALAEGVFGVGGTSSVADLGLDPAVRSALVGVNTKLQKFLSQYPEVFELTPDPSGSASVGLLVDPSLAVAAADVRGKLASGQVLKGPEQPQPPPLELAAEQAARAQALLNEVHNVALQYSGEVPLKTLGESPTIANLRKGIAQNLKKFLMRFPDRFQIVGAEEPHGGRVQVISF